MQAFLQFLLGAVQFLVGGALFSFCNVVAWRLPRGQSPLRGRSACPACGATLGAAELLPVISWLALGGKCRHCGAPIAPRYLLVELLGGVAALGCRARFGGSPGGLFGFSWGALLTLVFLGVLLIVSLIDAETQLIPDWLVLAVALCGLVAFAALPSIPPVERLAGAFCVSVPLFLVCLAVPDGFGGGDIKLMAAAGLFLGWKLTLLAAFLAILTGGGYGIWLLATRRKTKKEYFAFGPFLCLGMAAALFFGRELLGWYFQFLR